MFVVLFWIGPAIEGTVGKARTAITELALLVGTIAFFRYRQFPIREICRWNPVPVKLLPYVFLFGIGGAILLDGIDRLVGLIIPFPAEMLESYRKGLTTSTGWEKALVIFGVAIAAPLVEETIFRGAIQRTFENKSGVTKGVLLTALIFGLIHFQIAWLIQILVLSVFLGWMAWQWNSIVPALFLHAANNYLSYFVMFDMTDELKSFYLFHGQLNPAVALSAIAIAYYGLTGITRLYQELNYINTD